jgi:C2 domain
LLHVFTLTYLFTPQADPFVIVEFANKEVYRTKVIKKNREPEWNETYKLLIDHTERKYTVNFQVYDWDMASTNGMAQQWEQEGPFLPCSEFTLKRKKKKKEKKKRTKLHLIPIGKVENTQFQNEFINKKKNHCI